MIDKMSHWTLAGILALTTVAMAPSPVSAQASRQLDVEAAQALLDVQQLDGWLLYQWKEANPVASELVGVTRTRRQWFYWVPANGSPVAIVHRSESGAFTSVVGKKVTYSGSRQLKAKLKEALGESKAIAMEYAPASGIASLTRVDAPTAKMVEGLGVEIKSSAQLIQFTKSAWGRGGRVSHYVAAHHLRKLIDEAHAMIGTKVGKGELVTEFDVQQFILKGYRVRGLKGESPIVAAGKNSANPRYLPTARSSAVIKAGDLVVIELAGYVATDARPIYANLTWVAYVGAEVPARYHKTFRTVARARDKAIDLIRVRMAQRRPIAGFEADQAARQVIKSDGLGPRFTHRTGHSLDTDLNGDGANLDDHETHDTRNLVVGSGFTVGPGVYIDADFGMRTEVGVFLGAAGLEVTTIPQQQIVAIATKK